MSTWNEEKKRKIHCWRLLINFDKATTFFRIRRCQRIKTRRMCLCQKCNINLSRSNRREFSLLFISFGCSSMPLIVLIDFVEKFRTNLFFCFDRRRTFFFIKLVFHDETRPMKLVHNDWRWTAWRTQKTIEFSFCSIPLFLSSFLSIEKDVFHWSVLRDRLSEKDDLLFLPFLILFRWSTINVHQSNLICSQTSRKVHFNL